MFSFWPSLERLHFHFLLSCIGEGNGNPLPCSCLENPRDRGAWWAAVYGVIQNQTWLKRLSSSSSSSNKPTQHLGWLPQWYSGGLSSPMQKRQVWSWAGKIPWRRKWWPTPIFLPVKSHGQRSLTLYGPWDCKELDTTEHTDTRRIQKHDTKFSCRAFMGDISFLVWFASYL